MTGEGAGGEGGMRGRVKSCSHVSVSLLPMYSNFSSSNSSAISHGMTNRIVLCKETVKYLYVPHCPE